jgi:hypothetical protein
MIDPKIESAIEAALSAFSEYNELDATPLVPDFYEVFSLEADFLTKVDQLDELFDENPDLEVLREIFFDLLMINFFSADVKKLEEDYLDSPEWEDIEEQTLDRGTELLNLLLYLNECEDEKIEPSLEDYLKEFLLVDEDEFQDEHTIYEPVIANQMLMESTVEEIARVADELPEDTEIGELFYPMMCFFQNTEPTEDDWEEIADLSAEPDFDMAVLEILLAFNVQ